MIKLKVDIEVGSLEEAADTAAKVGHLLRDIARINWPPSVKMTDVGGFVFGEPDESGHRDQTGHITIHRYEP